MKTIGERVDFVRKEQGLSYQALADIIGGISGDGVRKAISRNTVKGYYINIISDKLGINKNWLLNGEGDLKSSSFQNTSKEFCFDPETIDDTAYQLVQLLETHYDVLMQNVTFKLWMNDKVNSGMFKFFKEHGIEVKVKEKE